MSDAEKRSVSTDALATLGTIITDAEKRDAIHLAVNPTQAQVRLYPGQDVGIDGTPSNPVGIVDPFLKTPVNPGEWFWLIVYPRQITSLRHVWTHPAFPDQVLTVDPDKRKRSEEWLRDYVSVNGDCPDYDFLIAAATGKPVPSRYGDDSYELNGEHFLIIGMVGNLAERGYSIDDVKDTLEHLHFACPSLKVKIHCGDDYESDRCIATVICAPEFVTHYAPKPEIEKIPELDEKVMEANMRAQLSAHRSRP